MKTLCTMTQASTFPVNGTINYEGVAVNNRGSATVTLTIGELNPIVVTVAASESYEGEFHPFKYLNATGGDNFELELRG